MTVTLKSCLAALLLAVCCGAEEPRTDSAKSELLAKFLTTATPAGGLGHLYLGRWREDYGQGMLYAQSALFLGGVGALALGFHIQDRNSNSDMGVYPLDNYAGILSLGLLGLWTGSKLLELYRVDRHFAAQGNKVAFVLNF